MKELKKELKPHIYRRFGLWRFVGASVVSSKIPMKTSAWNALAKTFCQARNPPHAK